MKIFRCALVALVVGTAFPVFAESATTGHAPLWQKPAGELWLNVGGFSRHFNRQAGHNENNLGLGLEYRTSDELSFMAGSYHNSVRKNTTYAAVNWQPLSMGSFKLGAAVGLMNGYPAMNRGGTFFAALPMATYEGRRFGVNLGLIPSMKDVDGAVILQFKVRLN
ncbi:MAG: hypothetical protein Q8M80_17110 [Hydrogenophaga sp.]|jgi:hypothetical protein|nr:hypothetical protein [Hydrogenophaga sp.]